MSPVLLELRELRAGYGGVPVVRGISLEVSTGEVVSLLGPNGAGKSTTLLTTIGALPALGGEVILDGRSISGLSPHEVARRGVALVPESRAIFRQLTVKQNLDLASRHRQGRSSSDVLSMFPTLERLLHRRAGLLSGGEQQMLALAKALLARPRLLMLDEPTLGLAPSFAEQLFPSLRQTALNAGMAILLVEQHVQAALGCSDRAYVIDRGRVILKGRSDELSARADIFESIYLGGTRV